MTHKTLIVLCAVMWISMGYFNNCVKFDLNNFNICTACAQNYYLNSGKCVACTDSTANKTQCVAKVASNDNQNLTQSSSTSTNQTNSTQASVNDPNKSKNVSESVATNLVGNNTNRTQGSKNQTTNSSSADNSNSANQSSTTSTAALVQVNPAQQFLSILDQQGLANCCQFAITRKGITCTKCQENFTLSTDKLCLPIPKNDSSKPPVVSVNTSSVTSPPVNNTVPQKIPSFVETKTNTLSNNSVSTKETTPSAQTSFIPFIPPQSSEVPPSTSSTSMFYSVINTTPQYNSSISNTPSNINSSNNKAANNISNLSQNTNVIPTQDVLSNNNPQSSTVQANPPPILNIKNNQSNIRFPIPNKPKDLNCAKANLNYSQKLPISNQNRRCNNCYNGFFYNLSDQTCQPQNPRCQIASQQNECLACYPGYIPNNGDCQISLLVTSPSPKTSIARSNQTKSSYKQPDSNCRQSVPNTNICLICATNFYLYNGTCKQANPLCKNYNPANGDCLGCYQGYQLNTTTNPISCSPCPQGSILLNGNCVIVSPLCKTYNKTTGLCLSCYVGYLLISGVCSIITQIVDPFCYLTGTTGCYQCNYFYYPDETGVCQPVSGFCSQYNKRTGQCTECISLYTVVDGECIFVY